MLRIDRRARTLARLAPTAMVKRCCWTAPTSSV